MLRRQLLASVAAHEGERHVARNQLIRDATYRKRRQDEREALLREQAARAEAERVAEMVSGMQLLVYAALAHRTYTCSRSSAASASRTDANGPITTRPPCSSAPAISRAMRNSSSTTKIRLAVLIPSRPSRFFPPASLSFLPDRFSEFC